MKFKILFILVFIVCLTPFVSAPLALVLGFLFTLLFKNPFHKQSSVAVSWMLKIAVVGLGFGMNLQETLSLGKDALALTISTILFVPILGFVLLKLLKTNSTIAYLISIGTAICGGSAIAAVSPIVEADEKPISISLGVVFLLNAVALLLFPFIGEFLGLSSLQFGLWCAVAIHDTSSVVGAAHTFGNEALLVATTVKLARVLWIIPISLISAFYFRKSNRKIKIPWFIGLFILAILLNNYNQLNHIIPQGIVSISKAILVASLFLIGTGLSIENIKTAGWPAFSYGLIIWISISLISLVIIIAYY